MEPTSFRHADENDVPAMVACRLPEPTDPRMAAYFRGQHHPQEALASRIGFVALVGDQVVGYVAGHLTTRHGCDGELQYLFVAPSARRQGIASSLVRLLMQWFCQQNARRICVSVDVESPGAVPLYIALGAHPLSKDKPFWYVWDDSSQCATTAGES